MKMDFLAEGSSDCPILRLYDFDAAEACQLRNVLAKLSNDELARIELNKEASVESADGTRLVLSVGPENIGIVRRKLLDFECILNKQVWAEMADLVEPFCTHPQHPIYQWLTGHGNISLLLSTDGKW